MSQFGNIPYEPDRYGNMAAKIARARAGDRRAWMEGLPEYRHQQSADKRSYINDQKLKFMEDNVQRMQDVAKSVAGGIGAAKAGAAGGAAKAGGAGGAAQGGMGQATGALNIGGAIGGGMGAGGGAGSGPGMGGGNMQDMLRRMQMLRQGGYFGGGK